MIRKQKRLAVLNEMSGKRICEFWNVEIEELIQDDGRTLKIFIRGQ
jgi:hypothetical protein